MQSHSTAVEDANGQSPAQSAAMLCAWKPSGTVNRCGWPWITVAIPPASGLRQVDVCHENTGHDANLMRRSRCRPYSRHVSQTTIMSKSVSASMPAVNACTRR